MSNFVWTEENIKYGSWICRAETEQFSTPRGWDVKWTHMIGFYGGSYDGSTLHSIADGLTLKPRTKVELIEYLNEMNFVPAHKYYVREALTYMGR